MNPHRTPATVEASPDDVGPDWTPPPRPNPERWYPNEAGGGSASDEERSAWDRYAAAAAAGLARGAWACLTVDSHSIAREAALVADVLLRRRRLRWQD